jgi:hypothetical protein
VGARRPYLDWGHPKKTGGSAAMYGKALRNYLMLSVAIAFICVAIFPIVFFYGISLMIEEIVPKRVAAKIERFWDVLGKPYNFLIRHVD